MNATGRISYNQVNLGRKKRTTTTRKIRKVQEGQVETKKVFHSCCTYIQESTRESVENKCIK